MFVHLLKSAGALAVLSAALALSPANALAQHHGGGGGHGGGSHGGGGHVAAYHGGSYHAGGAYHGGAYHGGYYNHSWYGQGYHGRGWYGGLGWGYPSYYGGYYPWYYGTYSYPYYDSGYSLYSEPAYGYSAPYDYSSAGPTPEGYYGDLAQPPATSLRVAHISVNVPADAELWFQGVPTTETGASREFVSPLLMPCREYTYDIRATWREGGRIVTQTRQIVLHAGDALTVDFTKPAS